VGVADAGRCVCLTGLDGVAGKVGPLVGVDGVLTAVNSGGWKEIAKVGANFAPGVGDGSNSMP
jgi:hypothetical protein